MSILNVHHMTCFSLFQHSLKHLWHLWHVSLCFQALIIKSSVCHIIFVWYAKTSRKFLSHPAVPLHVFSEFFYSTRSHFFVHTKLSQPAWPAVNLSLILEITSVTWMSIFLKSLVTVNKANNYGPTYLRVKFLKMVILLIILLFPQTDSFDWPCQSCPEFSKQTNKVFKIPMHFQTHGNIIFGVN